MRDIALREFNEKEYLAGEQLPEEQQVFSVKVISTFLKTDIPINIFQSLLEETGLRLAGHRVMSDLISFVHQEELKRVRDEVHRRNDGTTHLGEAMAVILRFVDEQWELQQRLIHFVKGEEVAHQLISVL